MTDQTAAALGLGGLALLVIGVRVLGDRVRRPLPDPHEHLFMYAMDATLLGAFALTLGQVAWACIKVLSDPTAVPEARAILWDVFPYLGFLVAGAAIVYPVHLAVRYVDAEDARRAEQRRADAHDGRQRERGRP